MTRAVQRACLSSRIASNRNRKCEFIRAPRATRRSVPCRDCNTQL